MLLATVGPLAGAPIAHLIGHWDALRASAGTIAPLSSIAPLAILPIHDRLTCGRIHPVSLWGGILVFVWFTVFFGLVAPTAACGRWAEWFVS